MTQKLTKLVCDICGTEYSDEDSVRMALIMLPSWERLVRHDGDAPRGCAPCPVLRCPGELILIEED